MLKKLFKRPEPASVDEQAHQPAALEASETFSPALSQLPDLSDSLLDQPPVLDTTFS